MIVKISKNSINVSIFKSRPSSPDRPSATRSYRKLIFFIIREGFQKTLNKLRSKIKSENDYQKQVLETIINSKAAISFDNGENYYIHSTGRSIDSLEDWYNPFSRDSDLEHVEDVTSLKHSTANVFIFGGGDYVRSYVICNFKKDKHYLICDYNDLVIENFYQFKYKINNWKNALNSWSEMKHPIGIVATYHSNHAIQAYNLATSNETAFIFVEKPPLVDYYSDFQKYERIYKLNSKIEIGFNRRYAKMIEYAKAILDNLNGPTILNFSVNEIKINSNHWYYWESEGTRITGNACHWIDLSIYLIKSEPIELTLVKSTSNDEENTLVIKFLDGSLSTITISEIGSNLRGVHEQLIMKKGNTTIHIDDFISITIDNDKGRSKNRSIKRDKGHDFMYKDFSRRVANHISGKENFITRYPLADLKKVTYITYHFSEMAKKNISSFKVSL